MSDNLIMADGRGTTTPRLEILFSSAHYNHNTRCSAPSQPDTPLRVEPDLLYYGPGQRWRCVDSYSDRSFGGSFNGAEIDHIVAEFRDWSGAISPGRFELIAQAAIDGRRARACGVAA